jgi:hypothetical protein
MGANSSRAALATRVAVLPLMLCPIRTTGLWTATLRTIWSVCAT